MLHCMQLMHRDEVGIKLHDCTQGLNVLVMLLLH
jgi:hypothetical protein